MTSENLPKIGSLYQTNRDVAFHTEDHELYEKIWLDKGNIVMLLECRLSNFNMNIYLFKYLIGKEIKINTGLLDKFNESFSLFQE